MVSFLFAVRKEKQQNNNPSSSSFVLTDDDVTDDDRVCLHVSVGDPCCPSCDHQQPTTNNKKRKRPRQQLTLKKKKKAHIINWDDDDDDDHSICLHLLLGSSSCIPTCVHQTNNNNNIAAAAAADDDHHQWVIKKVLEESDVGLHWSRLLLHKEVAQKFVIPFLLGGVEAAQTKQGIQVQVRDTDTNTLHSLVFKIWTSAKCHTFTKTWVKEFVQRRDLKKGDQIGLRWDQDNGRFDFSVLRRAKLFNS